jgi:hypothetical protein
MHAETNASMEINTKQEQYNAKQDVHYNTS